MMLNFFLFFCFQADQYASNVKDDPGYDNQPLCQIHQTLPGYHAQYQHGYNTHKPSAEYTLRNNHLKYPWDNRIVSDLNIPQRPLLGQGGQWPSNCSNTTSILAKSTAHSPDLVNYYSQVNIYAEPDHEVEADSGFNDELIDQI